MKILGIETSCDETSAAVIKTKKEKVELLSNIVASSLPLHAKTGGIIPEVAAREQVKFIIPVINKALESIKNPQKELDAIAVTVGPGLIGSLLVGVETARTLAYIWQKPLIPVNHLFGHIYANFVCENQKSKIKNQKSTTPEFPAIALVVSGGHTDLVLIENHNKTKWLGGTRDDAAGEAFDKTARLLNLPYPGGPQVEKLAMGITKDVYNFPRPLINSGDFDFSFSGLKTAVLREVQAIGQLNNETVANICYSLQNAIFDVLVKKTFAAAIKFRAKSILLGGGVAANQTLKRTFELKIENSKLKIKLFVPTKSLCTDNAAMIAAAGFFNYESVNWQKITANPELYFD
ncbi:MAG: tRNA (adenosine(37)-N6)-threonylcarbamoyltransferase complex transferase subunit TsaD [Patescibacteria group bacterium]|nr:tRNA (adenosine(37)-N6)-threonylcarbamoyltransferase complex transferase subunit TsaD [Patescibacteria group bacterium]